MVNSPKISIVMPVLNREDTIEKAILSVVNQPYKNYELIILDGQSTDGTLAIIKKYENYIAYYHSKKDGSPAIATNIGIEIATGDLVTLLMADDWYEPEILVKVAQAYLQNPDADVISCASKVVTYNAQTQQYKLLHRWNRAASYDLNALNICFRTPATCSRFVTKKLYDSIGLFKPIGADGKHIFSNDREFFLRAVIHHAKNVYVDYIGYVYLSHSGSATFANNIVSVMKICKEHMQICEMYLKKYPLNFKQKIIITCWYHDQAVRLFFYKIINKQPIEAMKVALTGLKANILLWPLTLCATTSYIIFNKSRRLIKHLVS